MNQIDLRIARTFAVGPAKLKGILDLYNLANASPVLVYNQAYGTTGAGWLVPQSVLIGRIIKFGGQLTF